MFCITNTRWNCVNFGGCYGYDLVIVFKEFLQKKCYFSNGDTAITSIRDLTIRYIQFLKDNYDHTIEYQEKENEKLVRKLIMIYNKQKVTKIKIHINKDSILTNTYLRL